MKQRGAGNGEAMLIMGLVVFYVFMGLYGNSLGYVSSVVGHLGSWTLPYLHASTGGAWYWLPWAATVSVVDVIIGLLNILGWVLQCLASYGALLSFGVTGGIPLWATTCLFIPPAFTLGWLVMEIVRG